MHANRPYLLLIIFSVSLACTHYAKASEITDQGLQAVLGASTSNAPISEVAPKMDGSLREAAWESIQKHSLLYSDERVDGSPINLAWVKFLVAKENLYVGIHGDGKINLAKAEGVDAGNIFRDSYMGLTWKTDSGAFLFIINAKGATYHGSKDGLDKEWLRAWTPTDAQAKMSLVDGGWQSEFCIPLKLLANKDGKIPALLPMDFLRRFWIYRVPYKPGFKMLRSFHCWKTRPLDAALRLTKQVNVFKDEDYGKIYFSEKIKNSTPLKAELKQQLIKASEFAQKNQSSAAQAKKVRQSGFEFSEAELKSFYPNAPITFVPLVKEAPKIDGDPSDQGWQASKSVTLQFLSEDIQGQPVRNKTHARFVSNSTHVFVQLICEESNPKAIKATPGLVDRGALWTEDICNIIFDVGRSQDEGSDGYVDFIINAAGSIGHSRRRSDQSWDPPSLKYRTRLFEAKKQWVIELSVAFKDLGVTPDQFPKVWGGNLLRSRAPDRGVWIDKLQTQDPAYLNFDFAWRGNPYASAHRPDYFGILYFEAGNALPENLMEALQKRGEKNKSNVKLYIAPAPKPIHTTIAKRPKAAFKKSLTVTHTDKHALISFELASKTDVAVTVADSKGKVVRHLVAGQLGAAAPVPLKKGALSQSLEWDFKNDAGKRVAPGTYSIQVEAGIQATFERHLLWNPNGLREVTGLSTDSKGNIYVTQTDHKVWYYSPSLLVFDRDGNYLKQIIPYSGILPPESLTGTQQIELEDKRRIPPMYHGLNQTFAAGQGTFNRQRFAVTSDGAVIIANGLRRTETRFAKRLLRIEGDGSLTKNYLGPILHKSSRIQGPSTIALSPDGRYAYVTGIRQGAIRHHVVYRVDLKEEKSQKSDAEIVLIPFAGEIKAPGAGEKKLNNPIGLAVDPKGNVYVADTGNDRIVKFSPQGKYLDACEVRRPEQVEVHPKTDALYVISVNRKKCVLKKFKNIQAKEPEKSIELEGGGWVRAGLDATQKKTRIWLTGVNFSGAPRRAAAVLAIDETAKGFENAGPIIAQAGGDRLNRLFGLPSMVDARIDPDGAKAIIWGVTVDTKTGKPLAKGSSAPRRGLDGKLYHKAKSGIRRYSPSNEKIPFESKSGDLNPGRGDFEFDVGPEGNIYILRKNGVHIFDTKGKLIKKNHIQVPQIPGTSAGANGTIRVDRQKCVYLKTTMKPMGGDIPDALTGRLPAIDRKPSLAFVYRHLYGSVVKFGPSGGRVIPDKKNGTIDWCVYGAGNIRCRSEGMLWHRFGMSPVRYRNVQHLPCTCEDTHFDIDSFGRVFLPDALQFNVEILDTNGNPLLRFGRYGNMDDDTANKGDPSQPAMAWPVVVEIRGKDLYIADRVNKRIIKMNLKYDAMEKKEIKIDP